MWKLSKLASLRSITPEDFPSQYWSLEPWSWLQTDIFLNLKPFYTLGEGRMLTLEHGGGIITLLTWVWGFEWNADTADKGGAGWLYHKKILLLLKIGGKLVQMTWDGPDLNPHKPVYEKCKYVWCPPIGLLISRAVWVSFKIMESLATGDSMDRMVDVG